MSIELTLVQYGIKKYSFSSTFIVTMLFFCASYCIEMEKQKQD